MTAPMDNPRDVPTMARYRWPEQSREVWHFVEREAIRRWPCKCKEAVAHRPGPHDDIRRPGWMTPERALYAAEVDIPVGSLMMAGLLLYRRVREGDR